jgi:hypothetical protein
VPLRYDLEITHLVDTAIYYLEKHIARTASGEIQGLTLWLAFVNVEHAILCLKLTGSDARGASHVYGSASRGSSHKKSIKIRPRKLTSSEAYSLEKYVEVITARLAKIKTTSDDYEKLLSELRACRDLLVSAIRRYSSI